MPKSHVANMNCNNLILICSSVPPNILLNIWKSAWAALPNTRIIPEYSCSLFWYSAVQLRQISPGRPEYSVVQYHGDTTSMPSDQTGHNKSKHEVEQFCSRPPYQATWSPSCQATKYKCGRIAPGLHFCYITPYVRITHKSLDLFPPCGKVYQTYSLRISNAVVVWVLKAKAESPRIELDIA